MLAAVKGEEELWAAWARQDQGKGGSTRDNRAGEHQDNV